jgi:hypothetical protein
LSAGTISIRFKIRLNNNVRGFEIQGLKTMLSMYADDSRFILSQQAKSLCCLIEDLDYFSNQIKSNVFI